MVMKDMLLQEHEVLMEVLRIVHFKQGFVASFHSLSEACPFHYPKDIN